jgi:hypothetical protein
MAAKKRTQAVGKDEANEKADEKQRHSVLGWKMP